MTDYVALVEYIVKSVVDHPDAVEVDAVGGRGRSETVEIRLAPEIATALRRGVEWSLPAT